MGGDKGLVCKCNAMTFQSLEKKNENVLKKREKKLASKSKQNSISLQTAAI